MGSPLNEVVCKAEDLSFRYNDSPALFLGLNLSIRAGEITVLYGPNGSGKTTMGKILLGLLRPIGGRVELSMAADKSYRSAVFQDVSASLLPWKKCLDNVAMPMRLRDTPMRQASVLATRSLKRFAPEIDQQEYPENLSGGQQQMVAWARAFVMQPGFVVLDEPFSALDTGNSERLEGELVQEVNNGIAAVLIVHDLDQALLLADRILLLTDPPIEDVTTITLEEDHPRGREFLTSQSANRVRKEIVKASS